MPESPRWLLARDRIDDAYKILKRIARSNGRSLPESYDTFVLEKTRELQKQGVADDDLEEEDPEPPTPVKSFEF